MSSYRKHTRSLLLGATALVGSLALTATPASAQQRQYDFDLPPQPLEAAVQAFARQAQQQVIFADTDMRGVTAPRVSGAYSADEALTLLLAGTDLKVRRTSSGVLKIAADAGPQGGSAAGNAVEALIVTAQKREEDIQDVPIAISAFSQEDLTRSQIAGGPDLITQVPNMTFTKTNFSSYSVQIRGIGTQAISATTDPAVAVAFNNTPFIRNRFFEQEFYDMERVEVLRGPQGTLYGRNATAGVVNLISAKPKFYAEAKASADISNYKSTRVEGMVNIPLVEDAVALRVAGAWTKRDGYATNEVTGNPIDGRDLWSTRVSLRFAPTDAIDANLIWEHFEENDDRLRSGKQLCKKDVVLNVGDVEITSYGDTSTAGGQSSFFAGVQGALSQGCKRNSFYAQDSFQRPNGAMLPYYTALGALELPIALADPYSDIPYGQTQTQDPVLIDQAIDQPEDLRMIASTIDPTYKARTDLGELQVSFDLPGGLSLTSETAYGADWVYSLQDFNRFTTAPGAWSAASKYVNLNILSPEGVFCDPQLGCSDRLVAVDISTASSRQFSQEFRLSSDFEGPFNFSLGANFLRADSEDKYYVFINSLSMIAAIKGEAAAFGTPYAPGVTDNLGCLPNGRAQGDPNAVYPVSRCTYMDPNPINSVSDEGHNYFLSKNPYKLISYAVFGESYYNVADNLKVTAGLRWTVDKKEAPRVPTWVLASGSVGYPVAEVIEQEWREPTGRLTVDWKPDLSFTDQTLVYGSYAHGYKAGGANPPGFVRTFYSSLSVAQGAAQASATRPKTFDAEFVDAFEVGSKNTLADGRVTLNLAAFYYDYTGYQVSEIVDRSAFNRNFDATVWGIELESDWRLLENLRLGFKGGYQKTRIADGEQAIDLMDRTAGDPDWLVVRPFPTYASSCVLPTFVFVNPNGTIGPVGGVGGGGPSGCEIAYSMGLDPVTMAPYVDLANGGVPGPLPPGIDGIQHNSLPWHPDYPGWDPTLDYGNNNGEGFFKQLGGNELPNAPNWTLTGTIDYTIPLPNDWLATLHADLHWQSESWWRVFNDHEYNKLDEYFTANIAAIFTNEERGWNVMAYVKNVTDETALTGAFLNSDDTGLTTNVFLTEPRLYGIRVTKSWDGGPLLGSFGERHDGPYAFTIELGGQVQRHKAPNEALRTDYSDAFAAPLDVFGDAQRSDLDWGDGRDVRLIYRPGASGWQIAAALRHGETNGRAHPYEQFDTDSVCALTGSPYEPFCALKPGDPGYIPQLGKITDLSATNWVDVSVIDQETSEVFDLMVGHDLALAGFSRSVLSAGLRHARLESVTDGQLYGVPDWDLPTSGFFFPGIPATHHQYDIAFGANRSFEGAGPVVAWEASYPLLDRDDAGQIDLDWSVSGGALFGDRKTSASIMEDAEYFETSANALAGIGQGLPNPIPVAGPAPVAAHRSSSVTVPTAAVSLGLSYEVDRFRVGAGYRWERYFDAIDGGYATAKDADRTIDGPYFKLAIGFGG